MAYCEECGKPMSEQAKFCSYCGEAVAVERKNIDSLVFVKDQPQKNTIIIALNNAIRRVPDKAAFLGIVLTFLIFVVLVFSFYQSSKMQQSIIGKNTEGGETQDKPDEKKYRNLILRGHNDKILSIAFSPDGKKLASASEDGKIIIWHTEAGMSLKTIDAGSRYVASVRFSSDGKKLASAAGNSSVAVWDVDTGDKLRRTRSESENISCRMAVFNREGNGLYFLCGYVAYSWELDATRENQFGHFYLRQIDSMSFIPEKSLLVLGGHLYDSRIKGHDGYQGVVLVDVSSKQVVKRIKVPSHDMISISSDGRYLAGASYHDTKIFIYELSSGQIVQRFNTPSRAISAIAFLPDNQTLVSADKTKVVRLWNVMSGHQIKTISDFEQEVFSVTCNPEGTLLAAGGIYGTIMLRNISETKNH